MKIYISQQAHIDFNNIFNYSIYNDRKEFCVAFIKYYNEICRSIDILINKMNIIFKTNGDYYRDVHVLVVDFNVMRINNEVVIRITHFRFKKWNSIIALCREERRRKIHNFKLLKSSKNINDYIDIPHGKAGEYNGSLIKIVKLKKKHNNCDFFNYQYSNIILSKYDFVSCGTFMQQEDGEYKAKAAALRHNWYWVYPTGKIKKIESKVLKENFVPYKSGNKIKLYEAIMKDIAKIVKRAISKHF